MVINSKPISMREYNLLCVKEHEDRMAKEKLVLHLESAKEKSYINEQTLLVEAQFKTLDKFQQFGKFSESVKVTLLSECIYGLCESAAHPFRQDGKERAPIFRNLISKFIAESNVERLLFSFRTKTLLLSEFNRIVTKYHKLITEAVDKDNCDSFVIDPEIKDNFFDELDMAKPDDVIINIRTRVADAVQEFIDGNIADKLDIKDIIQSVQDKIDSIQVGTMDDTTADEVKESYTISGKRAIASIRSKPKNVFGTMVHLMRENALKNEDLKAHYTNESGKVDLDMIVENCEVMYTLLEAVNTAKIVNVDETYIKTIVDSLKA